MDLSKLSDADLVALKAGDLSKVSDVGLQLLRGASQTSTNAPMTPAETRRKAGQMALEGTTGVERFTIGAGQAVGNLLGGAKQRGAELLNAFDRRLVSDSTVSGLQRDEAERRDRDTALGKGAAFAGNIAGNVLAMAPTAFVPGANTYTGSALVGALAGAAQPTTEGESVSQNIATGGAGGLGGKIIGDKLASAAAIRFGRRYIDAVDSQSSNAARDAILRNAREAGFVTPPTTVNPTGTNRVLESFAGKIATAQEASVKNQEVRNQLARQAIGVSDDAPLSAHTFRTVIKEANDAYDALKGIKQFSWTPDFQRGLQRLGNQTPDSVLPNPAAGEIAKVVESLDKPSFTGRELISTIRQLRRESNLAYRAGTVANDEAKLAIGQAKREAADLLESLAEDNLRVKGMTNLVTPFREARVRLAKLHTVERATNDAGDVSGAKLARMLGKGEPLSDELLIAARAAQSFGKAHQDVAAIGSPAVSNLRAAMMPLAGMAGYSLLGPAGIAAAAAPMATYGVRNMLLSRPYQNLMAAPPTYSVPRNVALAHALLQSPNVRQMIPAAAASGALTIAGRE